MKKIIGLSLFLFFGTAAAVNAQSKVEHAGQEAAKGAKHAGHAVKKGAKKAGNKTAELASKGESKTVHKSVKDKVGPDGQTIYLDDNRYYWVDKKGHRQYIDESQLKPKN